MKSITEVIGKFLYALIFLVCIPVLLWFWAETTQNIISYPAIESTSAGSILMVIGGALMVWAMIVLRRDGKGLPMNAYPPIKMVNRGPYRLLKHPIYWGFGMLIVGYSLFVGSASALWFVSPLTILGMTAIVLGYEAIDLKQRFPDQRVKTLLDLPEAKPELASLRDRIASLVWILFYLLICNFIIVQLEDSTLQAIGKPLYEIPRQVNQYMSVASILFLIAVPFSISKKEVLRMWVIAGILSLGLEVFMGLLYPIVGSQYLPGNSWSLITPIFLILISLKAVFTSSWKISIGFTIIGTILALWQISQSPSPILLGIHALIVFLISAFYTNIWNALRELSEKIANSWKEWVFGNIRVINHGFYIGFGVFFGVLYAGILAGKEYALALLVFSVLVTICSALWAQIIEGSAKLKRPFGYYGGLVGILIGCLAMWIMGINGWVIIGVISVVMPWVQAIGRLRCLVNGCCHGSRTSSSAIGIRYHHHRSRVCNISGLKGELLHPTQLYAIIWLFFVGFLLLALWQNGFSYSFIFGMYLILTGLGRFVEEAYRGEVQTPNIRTLHLYQWTAIISVMVGIAMTFIKVAPVAISPGFSWDSLLVATLTGFFLFFAMGVDFPNSNVRFSRLV